MGSRRKGWRLLTTGASSRPEIFEEDLLPHLDALYGLAMRLTRDADDAADLLQDTALRAFERFGQLRERGAARAWLVRILTTTFLNHYAARHAEELEPRDEQALDETPETALLRQCEREEVEAALRDLPETFRLTVLLADVEELPLREIASICRCPVGTAASRLARGRRMLRERLRGGRRAEEVDA